MAIIKEHKVSSLPSTLEPNAKYYVDNWNWFDMHITDSSWNLKNLSLWDKVSSNITGITSSTQVQNIIIITSSWYDNITPDPNTYYIIRD